ncbi:hypothetical protein [Mycobacterium decipiens]|uniref:Uncharacterized protein n=1 Tax=Mycobacterium decipiens TaxID=1430326 RepID=A0A1X2LUW5_9MYCO|nr:hypothetical protein [Mycobacterium decipiens]OSC40172.1 hypothetical protein B8W66_13810 [Mycobacterium decipiens]
MTVTYLAANGAAFQAGYLIAALGVPTLGWVLLIVGLKQRSSSRDQPGVHRTDPLSPPQGGSPGTRLIIIGLVLMALGVLAILGRLATAG